LCERAEALSARLGAGEDLLMISRELMDVQEQWKLIGPVPTDQAKDLWQRFHEICDGFFKERKDLLQAEGAVQQRNAEVKQALVAEVRSLADSTRWRETGERIKSLQKQWRDTGPAPRPVEQQLWQEFKTACDGFFSRRKAYFEEKDQQRAENAQEKERLCLTLEALGRLTIPEAFAQSRAAPSAEQLRIALDLKDEVIVPDNPKATWDRTLQKVRDAQRQWKTLGASGSPENDDALWQRFKGAADLFFSHRPESVARKAENSPAETSEGS